MGIATVWADRAGPFVLCRPTGLALIQANNCIEFPRTYLARLDVVTMDRNIDIYASRLGDEKLGMCHIQAFLFLGK